MRCPHTKSSEERVIEEEKAEAFTTIICVVEGFTLNGCKAGDPGMKAVQCTDRAKRAAGELRPAQVVLPDRTSFCCKHESGMTGLHWGNPIASVHNRLPSQVHACMHACKYVQESKKISIFRCPVASGGAHTLQL